VTFKTLALLTAVGLLGPLLAIPKRVRVPILLGELLAGILLGRTGARVLHPTQPTFTFLANIGFALIMFVAGSHIPVRDDRLRAAIARGAGRAVGIGFASLLIGWSLARVFDTGHTGLYAVLLASSSAALILPMLDDVGASGTDLLDLLPQVAIADTACIVALPLVIEPSRAGRAAVGSVAVIAAAVVLCLVLEHFERTGTRRRLHHLSEERNFALELRISLLILFGLAALANQTHVSIMLAGFAFGLAVAAVGEPRRLAKQLFALTEGFFGPLFFVWIGATLNLRALGSHPKYILLGVLLGAGAVLAHVAARLTGQPAKYGVIASAQLGVPIAAVTLGTQRDVLKPGEPAALLLAAIVTIAAATLAVSTTARTAPAKTPS
jgi:Kef-type K+ transport system membrane component KefB